MKACLCTLVLVSVLRSGDCQKDKMDQMRDKAFDSGTGEKPGTGTGGRPERGTGGKPGTAQGEDGKAGTGTGGKPGSGTGGMKDALMEKAGAAKDKMKETIATARPTARPTA